MSLLRGDAGSQGLLLAPSVSLSFSWSSSKSNTPVPTGASWPGSEHECMMNAGERNKDRETKRQRDRETRIQNYIEKERKEGREEGEARDRDR